MYSLQHLVGIYSSKAIFASALIYSNYTIVVSSWFFLYFNSYFISFFWLVCLFVFFWLLLFHFLSFRWNFNLCWGFDVIPDLIFLSFISCLERLTLDFDLHNMGFELIRLG